MKVMATMVKIILTSLENLACLGWVAPLCLGHGTDPPHRGRADSSYQQGCPSCTRQKFEVNVFAIRHYQKSLQSALSENRALSLSCAETETTGTMLVVFEIN